MVQNTQSDAMCFLTPRCNCLALLQIHDLLPSCHHFHLVYPSHHLVNQLIYRIPLGFHIRTRQYCDSYFGFFSVKELVWTTRYQRHQCIKHSLLYECQFQVIQSVTKYVLPLFSSPYLVSCTNIVHSCISLFLQSVTLPNV